MASNSGIEWTQRTWNPATGCSKVSPGCDNCYMFRDYPRLNSMGVRGYEKRPDVVQLIPDRLMQPLGWRKPTVVFVNSMSDLFHRDVTDDFIDQVFITMYQTPQHTYQILTKRPGRIPPWWEFKRFPRWFMDDWPPNVWIGTSIENQKYVPRADVLARVPAAVRFLSIEPMLGPVDLSAVLGQVQWVIVGGESGPGARPMEDEWARQVRDDCADAGVPFFLKQLGGNRDKRGGDAAVLDGRLWREMPGNILGNQNK